MFFRNVGTSVLNYTTSRCGIRQPSLSPPYEPQDSLTFLSLSKFRVICPLLLYLVTLLGLLEKSSRLRHCPTNRKVESSIPDGVTGIFHWHNPSGRPMALGSTQPPTEMSTRNIPWGKGGRCVGLTTLPHSRADCLEIWEPQPLWTLRTCPGL